MAICKKSIFGHNFEITRAVGFGGIYSERLINRKLSIAGNGFYSGFYEIKTDFYVGMGQTQSELFLKANVNYSAKIRLKTNTETKVNVKVKSHYHKVYYENTFDIDENTESVIEDSFTSFFTQSRCRFEITWNADAKVEILSLSLKETDNFFGMRRDVLDALKEIKPYALRFPGGCFAEYYVWKEGLLDIDKRPCSLVDPNLDFILPFTSNCDSHEIGIDEFIELCRYVGAEPEITVRLKNNNPQDAADLVEYCNGDKNTKWGAVRISRGYEEPFKIKTWYVGNELALFGSGEMRTGAGAAKATDEFAKAMKSVDSSITIVASTGFDNVWDEEFLDKNPLFDYMSFHKYTGFELPFKTDNEIQKIILSPYTYVLPRLISFHDTFKKPFIFDEWNFVWGEYGNALTAIFCASMLHMLTKNAESLELVGARYFTLINEGAIRVTPEKAEIQNDGIVFSLLAQHGGNEIIENSIIEDHDKLDVFITKTPDNKQLFVSVINLSIEDSLSITIKKHLTTSEITIAYPENETILSDRLSVNYMNQIPDKLPKSSILFAKINL